MPTSHFLHKPTVLILYRFGAPNIEHFVSNILVPELRSNAKVIRIQQAGNEPGEVGYWLHIYHILSGLVDAVITVGLTSETYSENIFFEQTLLQPLTDGESVKSKVFSAESISEQDSRELAKPALLWFSILDLECSECFVWFHKSEMVVTIDMRTKITAQEILDLVRQGIRRMFRNVDLRLRKIGACHPSLYELELVYLIACVYNPKVSPALRLEGVRIPKIDEVKLAHLDHHRVQFVFLAVKAMFEYDSVLAWWKKVDAISRRMVQPEDAAGKIAAAAAKRWRWLIRRGEVGLIRKTMYQLLVWVTMRVQAYRYNRCIRAKGRR